MIRKIQSVVTGVATMDGAGVKLVRVLGGPTVKDFNPFLMLDAFDSVNPADYIKGFPWHPHRGIETITYLIEGKIEHGDSLGNRGAILAGCTQWMTAGSGIMHQEMPKPAKRMLGVQLWLNLPAKDKMTKPQYRDLKADQVPQVNVNGVLVHILSGHYQNREGATQGDYVKTLFLDVEMPKNSVWKLAVGIEETLFIYIFEGEGMFEENNNHLQPSRRAILFGPGDEFLARTLDQGVRFLLLAAKPLKESVAWGGPIVMNTHKELQQAFRELEEGTFIK